MCIKYNRLQPPHRVLEKLCVSASRALAVSAARHQNNSVLINVKCRNVQYMVYMLCQCDILSMQRRDGE